MPGGTNFPGSLDTLTNLPNPVGADLLDNSNPNLDHDYQHTSVNDALRAIETKLGINSSADATSVDYKIRKGSFIRATTSCLTTSAIAQNASQNLTVPLGKTSNVLRLTTNYPAWVRLYSTSAYQAADSSRDITTDPTGEHGVLLECITTSINLDIGLAPSAWIYSLEAVPGATIPVTVTNKDSVSRQVLVTLEYVPMEG